MLPRPSDIQVVQLISRISQVISRLSQVIFRISQVIFKLTWLFPRPADRRDCWAGASASTAHTSVADEETRGIHDINNRDTKTPNNCQIFIMRDHLPGNHYWRTIIIVSHILMWKRIVGSLIQNMSPQLRNLDISFTINFLDTAPLNKWSVLEASAMWFLWTGW